MCLQLPLQASRRFSEIKGEISYKQTPILQESFSALHHLEPDIAINLTNAEACHMHNKKGRRIDYSETYEPINTK